MLGVVEGQGRENLKLERTVFGLYSLMPISFIVFAKFRSQVVFVSKKFDKFTQVFQCAF